LTTRGTVVSLNLEREDPTPPMKRLPSWFEEDGKQRENLLRSLKGANESCFGNESGVLARPNIPLLVFGKFFRGKSELESVLNALESVQPEIKSETLILDFGMNKASLPVSPEKIASTNGLIMLAPHVLFVQPGLKGPLQLVHPASLLHCLDSQEMGM
jgi:hypothetical protein